jgi:hypothetical protein
MQYANRSISQAPPSTPFNIAGANAGVQIKDAPGTLVSININTVGTLLTLFDGTSTAGIELGSWSIAALEQQIMVNVAFQTGLFAVTTGAGNVTIGFR